MKKELNDQGTCFVIMPFGAPFDTYYEHVYKPAISDAGLAAIRADDLFRPSSIVGDIWQLVLESKVLLADLTQKNPNVFYELGLAHASGKPVVMVSETIDDIPFDLRALRVLEYDKNHPDWGSNLRISITLALREVLEHPVSAIPGTFLRKNTHQSPEPPTAYEKQISDLKRTVDSLYDSMTGGAKKQVVSPSVFISYSNKDQDFAEMLHSDLQRNGVRCWFAPEDMKIGDKIRSTIDDAIREHSKLLIVLSKNSIGSPWVEHEVETALDREQQTGQIILFPIRLDTSVMDAETGWAGSIRRTRHIGDFRKWRDMGTYQDALMRLLRDLMLASQS